MSREPSMEEILSSIRRVIARDEAVREETVAERTGGSARSSAEPVNPVHEDADEDVLDLTEMETPPVTDLPAAIADAPATPLVSADSEVATRQAIGQLTAALEQDAGATAPAATSATADLTVQAMAEAALRPMLKAWLDTNLPPLVERLVAQEIARITGGRL